MPLAEDDVTGVTAMWVDVREHLEPGGSIVPEQRRAECRSGAQDERGGEPHRDRARPHDPRDAASADKLGG